MIGGDGRTYVGRGWVSLPEIPERFQDKKGDIYSVAFIGPRGKKNYSLLDNSIDYEHLLAGNILRQLCYKIKNNARNSIQQKNFNIC